MANSVCRTTGINGSQTPWRGGTFVLFAANVNDVLERLYKIPVALRGRCLHVVTPNRYYYYYLLVRNGR